MINTLDREADDEQEEVRGHAALQILARRRHRQVFGLQLPAWLPINPVGNVAINPANPLILQSGGPGRTRTCNQTVMSGRL